MFIIQFYFSPLLPCRSKVVVAWTLTVVEVEGGVEVEGRRGDRSGRGVEVEGVAVGRGIGLVVVETEGCSGEGGVAWRSKEAVEIKAGVVVAWSWS